MTTCPLHQVCYRKNGHNEIDEPSFTQPRMYKAIGKHPHVLDQYAAKLVKEGVMTDQEYQVSSAAILADSKNMSILKCLISNPSYMLNHATSYCYYVTWLFRG